MPPVTPSTMTRPGSAGRGSGGGGIGGAAGWARGLLGRRLGGGGLSRRGFALRFLGGERDRFDLAGFDLLHGDRQRLAGHRGDLRRDDLAEALPELVVVVVDLPGPLGGQG